jgi:hypothetical protein
MPEIQVIFPAPATTNPTELTNTRVLAPTLVARERDRINWIFYNCDKRVGYVEVEFENVNYEFFPGSNMYGKPIEGNGDIYGYVPDLKAEQPVLAKYTVRAWDSAAKATKCSELDPEILINEP